MITYFNFLHREAAVPTTGDETMDEKNDSQEITETG